mgnify:CR=1 FL=1
MEKELIDNILAITEQEIKGTDEIINHEKLEWFIKEAEEGLTDDMLGYISSLLKETFLEHHNK